MRRKILWGLALIPNPITGVARLAGPLGATHGTHRNNWPFSLQRLSWNLPTVFTHAIAGAAIALAVAPSGRVRTTVALAVGAAILPDLDAIGYVIGTRHHLHGLFGHRGITHSLLFASAVAIAAGILVRRTQPVAKETWRVLLAVFAAALSHGMLDALTNGGSGVAFLAPFDNARYFFPVRPISVSPLRASALFTTRGITVMRSEVFWVWLPATAVAVSSLMLRARRKTARERAEVGTR